MRIGKEQTPTERLESEVDRIAAGLPKDEKPLTETAKRNKKNRVYFTIALEELASRRDALTADNMRALCQNETPPWNGRDFDKLSGLIADLKEDYLETKFEEEDKREAAKKRWEPSGVDDKLTEISKKHLTQNDLVAEELLPEMKSIETKEIKETPKPRLPGDIIEEYETDAKTDNRVPNVFFKLRLLDSAINGMNIEINRGEHGGKLSIGTLRNCLEDIKKAGSEIEKVLEGGE